jgi:hypothetical protein
MVGSKKYTLTELVSANAAYASPAGHAIAAHTSLTGTLTVSSSITKGDYDVETLS